MAAAKQTFIDRAQDPSQARQETAAAGLPLFFRLSGPAGRPVILFLHGFLGSGEEWEEIIALLGDRFQCLTVDLPGHGRSASSDRRRSWSMENTAKAVIALLQRLGIRECFLAGYSMGGRLALYLTLAYPQYFAKAILESASPGLKTEPERRERIARDEQLARRLEAGDFREFLHGWYRQPLFQTLVQHPRFEEIFQNRLQNDPRGLAKSLRDMGTGAQPSLWEQLPGNKIPLLLVVGEKDAKFRALAGEMAEHCRAIRIETIAGCGHNVHVENAGAFAEALIKFASE